MKKRIQLNLRTMLLLLIPLLGLICEPSYAQYDYMVVGGSYSNQLLRHKTTGEYIVGFCIAPSLHAPSTGDDYQLVSSPPLVLNYGGFSRSYSPYYRNEDSGDQPMGVCATSPSVTPRTICKGESTTLSGSCQYGSIRWYSNSNATNPLSSITVSPATTTTYYATCVNSFRSAGSYWHRSSDSQCETPTKPVTVTVTSGPPAPSTSTSATICRGENTTLTGACTTGTIRWYNNSSLTTALGNTTVSPAATSSYYAVCQSGNCVGESKSVTVTVSAAPVAPTVSNRTICAGESVTLQGSCSSGGSIKWYSNSSLTAVVSSITVSPSSTTTYYATCETVSCKSSSASATVTVTPGGVNVSQANFTRTNPATCSGAEGGIRICGLTSGTSYSVQFNRDNAPQSSRTLTADGSGCINLSGLTSGRYTHFNITNNTSGCSSGVLYGVSVTLDKVPDVTITSTSYVPEYCGDPAGYIDISGLSSGTQYTLYYNKDGVEEPSFTFTASGTTYRWNNPGVGVFDIRVSNGSCTSNTVTETITDGGIPLNISAYPHSPTTCMGNDGRIYIQGLGSPKTYTFHYSKGGIPQTAFTVVNPEGSPVGRFIEGLAAGVYTIYLTDDGGCTSNSVTVELRDVGAPRIEVAARSYPSTCGGQNGSFTISGLAPGVNYTISYEKDGISQTPVQYTAGGDGMYTATNLMGGLYSNIRILDTDCESNRLSVRLEDPGAPVISLSTTTSPTACASTNGSIVFRGLTSGLQYTLSYVKNGAPASVVNFTASGASYTLSGLSSGLYTGIAVTRGGCTSNPLSASLTSPQSTNIGHTVTNTSSCEGSDGKITITGLVSGQSYTLNYSKNGASQPAGNITNVSGTSYILNNLSAGEYTNIRVTFSGCESNSLDATVKDPVGTEAPLASSMPDNICAGSFTELEAVCGSGTVRWYSDALLSLEVTNTRVNPASTTVYYAVCVENGCKSEPAAVTVTVIPAPQLPVTSAVIICEGETLILSETCTGGTIRWFSDSELTMELSSNSVVPESTTTYYAVCSSGGCNSSAASKLVTVKPLPELEFAMPVCSSDGLTYSVEVTVSAGALLSTSTGSVTGNTVSGIPSGTQATITALLDGCELEKDIIFECPALCTSPNPTVSEDVTICLGQEIILTAEGCSGSYGYTWSNNGVIETITVTPEETTTYQVWCINYDNHECLSETPAEVTVTVVPAILITASAPECNLAGTMYSVTITATAGAEITTTAGTVSGSRVSDIPSGATAIITATIGDCSEEVTVMQNCTIPCIPPNPTVTGAVTICADEDATLTASGCTTGFTYLWSNAATTAAITVTPGTTTTYTVKCVSSTVAGCESTIPGSATVTVNAIPTITAGTPVCVANGLTYSVTFTIPTGATIASSAGIVAGNVVSGIPSGTTATVTVSHNGCTRQTEVTQNCTAQIFDLALRKVLPNGVKNPTVTLGSTITFKIEVWNQGTVAAQNIAVIDYIPGGLTLADGNWTPGTGVATLTNPIAALAAGDSTSVNISFTVNADFTGSIRNFAEISGADNVPGLPDVDSTPDTDPDNDGTPKDDEINNEEDDEDDHDYEDITVSPAPVFDLALRKVLPNGVKNPTVTLGSTVTFKIEVWNQGTVAAQNIAVIDYIPEGLTLADGNWTPGTGVATLTNPIAALAAGDSTSVNISFTVDSDFTGSIRNFAEISGADNIPGLPDVDSTPDTDPDNDGTPKDNEINNEEDDEDDHDYEDITVSPAPVFDLALRKVLPSGAKNPTVAPGSTVTFKIEVWNQGTVAAQNIAVVDYIPEGLTLADGNWTPGTGVATLTNPIAALAAGDSTSVNISFTVDADFTGGIRNFAEISGADNIPGLPDVDSTPDTDPDNDGTPKDDEINNAEDDEDDHDYEDITVSPAPVFDLALRKVLPNGVKKPTVTPGSTVIFKIEVWNQGTVAAQNIAVIDYIPEGLTLADGNWTPGTGVATLTNPIATLAAGDSTSVNISFTVNADFTGSIRNFAEISGADNIPGLPDVDSTPDNDPDNDGTPKDDEINNEEDDEDDHDYEDITVSPAPVFDLALRKTMAPGSKTIYKVGDEVTFNITVFNQGTVTATSVDLVDYIPAGLTLEDDNWTLDGDKTRWIGAISNLVAGAQQTVQITFIINSSATGVVINTAEISGATNPENLEDKDSTLDDEKDNDGPVKNDEINEDGKNNPNDDEDDHDIESITICPDAKCLNVKTVRKK